MKPVIVIVGRPNVGKSTLFNRLTRSRDALVADFPGLTRDRHYGEGRVGGYSYFVVDTGGFEPVEKQGIFYEMAKQTKLAIFEANLVIFLVDARQGLTYQDQDIANFLRNISCPVLVSANKAEGMTHTMGLNVSDFYELGLGAVYKISAEHGDGVSLLIDQAFSMLHLSKYREDVNEDEEASGNKNSKAPIKLAIVGRPNVGKSTLINALIGEEKVVVFDAPGTTRDTICIDWVFEDKSYSLFDTAGLRKSGKIHESIEKFSVIKTLQAIEGANVVVLLLDAHQDVSDQDAHIAGVIVECGRALVVAVNKCDNINDYHQTKILASIKRKLGFLDFARVHWISASKRMGFKKLMCFVDEAYDAAISTLSTPKLTRALIAATTNQAPQRHGIIRPKLRYAHQGGRNPPIVVIHGNALHAVTQSYKRYLIRYFRDFFKLVGTPMRIEFRSTRNPYVRKK